ncbi:hypothetical protein [Halococcus salsus]|nr:hypothetical protein [Halococcus salsus]
MQCSDCGEFCITALDGSGNRYRIGASGCPSCGESKLRSVEDTRTGPPPA